MKLKFYRDLELLSRIYIFNYSNLQILAYPSVIKYFNSKTIANNFKRVSNLQIQLNYANVLACLTKNKQYGIFSKIYLEILKNDSNAKINSKILRVLQEKIKKFDFSMLSMNHDSLNVSQLLDYKFLDVVSSLIFCYFNKYAGHLLNKVCINIGLTPNDLNKEIIKIINNIDLNKFMLLVIKRDFQHIDLFVRQHAIKEELN